MPKSNGKNSIALIVIIVLQLSMIFFFGFQKQGFHIDEIYSYRLANGYFDREMTDTRFFNSWTESEALSQLIVVPKEHRFAYDSVFYNQGTDVHPPLFYLFLHTISSFFPEEFSKWYGISINIVFFVLCNIFLYLTSKKIFGNQFLALLPSIIWGFSAGAVSTVVYIRMYMMLTTLIMMFVYFHFKLMEDEYFLINAINIFAISVFGFMTQYYFLIFSFFLVSFYCLYWLIQKKRKQLIQYIAIFAGALFTGYLIFPQSITQIFTGYRGEEAITNFSSISDLQSRFAMMSTILSNQQFGGYLEELILIFISLYLLIIIFKFIPNKLSGIQRAYEYSEAHSNKFTLHALSTLFTRNIHLISLTITMIFTFIVIAKISPYFESRYLFFLYPIFSLLFIFYIYKVCSILLRQKQKIFITILLLFATMTTFSYKQGQVQFIYPEYKDIISTARSFRTYNCIYITDLNYLVNSNIFDLSELRNIYSIKVKEITSLSEILNDSVNDKGIILYIDRNENQDELLQLVLANTIYTRSTFLYSTDMSYTYLIE